MWYKQEEVFPFLFGGAFIEAGNQDRPRRLRMDFPSFLEGLSLRRVLSPGKYLARIDFPSFLEGLSLRRHPTEPPTHPHQRFPFLFGGAFIEAGHKVSQRV